jgi:predicted aspartyl protease
MLIGALVLFSTAMLNQKPAPVFADVFIGARGPYRFVVDTGAETTVIDPKLAKELRLQPEFQVELITQHSRRSVPAVRVRNLRIGDAILAETELVFHPVAESQRFGQPVRGLLGLNALAGRTFSLTPTSGRLEIDGARPAGDAIPLRLVEGRLALTAAMGEESLVLALDSGSTHTVLFRTPAAMAKVRPVSTTFATLEGARSVVPTCWTAAMTFGGIRIAMLPAAIVERKGTALDGLLPASAFQSIYIDRGRGEAVLSAKPASAARN